MDDSTLTLLLCNQLARIPGWAFRTASAYLSTEVAIFYGAIHEEPWRAAVGVQIYDSSDDAVAAVNSRKLQLRLRGEKGKANGADVLARPAFVLLTGLSRTGGISGIVRNSMAPLGADGNGREERTDNFTILLDNPKGSIS